MKTVMIKTSIPKKQEVKINYFDYDRVVYHEYYTLYENSETGNQLLIKDNVRSLEQ